MGCSFRYGAITIPHIGWIELLRLEYEDFAHAMHMCEQPRAHGGGAWKLCASPIDAQKALREQEKTIVIS